MPFNWQINIVKNKSGNPRVKFDPNPENNPAVGDEIIWTNHDTVAHWPGLKNSDGSINATYFMPNQIAPNSPSITFVPGASGALSYACSLHPDETGIINVS